MTSTHSSRSLVEAPTITPTTTPRGFDPGGGVGGGIPPLHYHLNVPLADDDAALACRDAFLAQLQTDAEVLRIDVLFFLAPATPDSASAVAAAAAAAAAPAGLDMLHHQAVMQSCGTTFGTPKMMMERVHRFVTLKSTSTRKLVVLDNADLLPLPVQSELRALTGRDTCTGTQFVLLTYAPEPDPRVLIRSLQSRFVLLSFTD